MSWICDFCSTSNEDTSTECYVCGQKRSEASIREAARLAREEHERRIEEKTNKIIFTIAKITFVSSLAAGTIFATLSIAILMFNGNIVRLFNSVGFVGAHFWERISEAFGQNVVSVVRIMSRLSVASFPLYLELLFHFMIEKISGQFLTNIQGIYACFVNSFHTISSCLSLMWSHAFDKAIMFWKTVTSFIDNIKLKFSNS